MKKLIFTSSAILALARLAAGQGILNWSTISFVAMTAQTNASQYSSFIGGGGPLGGEIGATAPASTGLVFDYALLYAPFNGFPLSPPTSMSQLIAQNWQFSGLMATNSNVAGRLVPVSPNFGAIVPWAAGVTNNIMLVGWSANLGSSWLVVSNELMNWNLISGSLPDNTYAFFGTSMTGYIAAGPADSVPGPSVFGSVATYAGLPIYSLNTQLYAVSVPEPEITALISFSGFLLLAFRRKMRT